MSAASVVEGLLHLCGRAVLVSVDESYQPTAHVASAPVTETSLLRAELEGEGWAVSIDEAGRVYGVPHVGGGGLLVAVAELAFELGRLEGASPVAELTKERDEAVHDLNTAVAVLERETRDRVLICVQTIRRLEGEVAELRARLWMERVGEGVAGG